MSGLTYTTKSHEILTEISGTTDGTTTVMTTNTSDPTDSTTTSVMTT